MLAVYVSTLTPGFHGAMTVFFLALVIFGVASHRNVALVSLFTRTESLRELDVQHCTGPLCSPPRTGLAVCPELVRACQCRSCSFGCKAASCRYDAVADLKNVTFFSMRKRRQWCKLPVSSHINYGLCVVPVALMASGILSSEKLWLS